MSRFKRLEVLGVMVREGLVPVFYHPDAQTACRVTEACTRGGARLMEFTNRGDGAIEVFASLEKFCREEQPRMILGVGSIVDAPTAALYIAHGANFIVGPNLNPEVARLCNRRKVAYAPGCGSASEIAQAEELGCEIVKIFPGGSVGGPGFVKSILGPCPWSLLMPTGGVECSEESLTAWFKAGVVCVGLGSNLITSELVESGDFEGITKKVTQTLAIIAKVRGQKWPV